MRMQQIICYQRCKRLRLLLITLCLYFLALCIQAYSKDLTCEDQINPVVAKYFPNYSIVQLQGLDQDLQEYFLQNYHDMSPGCIKEDFDGDGLSDYALLLRTKVDGKFIEKVVVLRGKNNQSFIPITLDILKDRTGSFFIRREL